MGGLQAATTTMEVKGGGEVAGVGARGDEGIDARADVAAATEAMTTSLSLLTILTARGARAAIAAPRSARIPLFPNAAWLQEW